MRATIRDPRLSTKGPPPLENSPTNSNPACASSSSAPPPASGRQTLATITRIPATGFWRAIHEVGITPRRFKPREFPALLQLGIGFTDLCKTGAGMDHEALAFPVDVPAFRDKMLRVRPKAIAFTSKKAASLFYGRPNGGDRARPAAGAGRFS